MLRRRRWLASSRRPYRPRACLLGLALAAGLAACGYERALAPSQHRETVLMTEADDARAGEEQAQAVAAEMGLVSDPRLQALVQTVGERLARQAPPRAFVYRFQIVDQWSPNAFALPGGAVFVSRGALALTSSEDELAGVLGHEIAHVALRHAAARQAVERGLGPFALGFGGARYLAAFSREQESEADEEGQRIAAAAGYDPRGLATFLQKLRNSERLLLGASRLPTFFDTHPATGTRFADMATSAEHLTWRRTPGVAGDAASYVARLEGLVVGDDPSEGFFRGNRFLHPDLDFTLVFPDGWMPVNTPAAVGAVAPQGNARVALELAAEGTDPQTVAREFLRVDAPRMHAVVDDARPITISGLPGYQVSGRLPTPGGLIAGRITWLGYHGRVFELSAAAVGAASGESLDLTRIALRSFRPLTAEERRAVQVMRLHVAHAHQGETLADVARRAKSALDLERTALANGVFPETRLAPGTPVKVAVAEAYVSPAAAQ